MTILGDDSDSSEGSSRSQDCSNVMRIRHLVEDKQDGPIRRIRQNVVEPRFIERLDLDHDALVRSIVRHEAAEVGRFRKGDRDILRELHEAGRLAGCPGAQDFAVRIIERCRDCMLAPESRPVRCAVALVRFLPPGHFGGNAGEGPRAQAF